MLEADFQRFYRLDLRDPIPPRRLWALIQGLPPDAAVWREEMAWTPQQELMATTIEVIDLWGRRLMRMQGAKSSQLPEAIQIPRPGEQKRKRVETDARKIKAFMDRHFKRSR